MSDILKIWDPHFHVFDISDNTASGHDRDVLSLPPGALIYPASQYEQDIAATGAGFELIGGTWLEAASVCHKHKSGPELTIDCLAEAHWASAQLSRREKHYLLIPSAPLEDPAVEATLAELATDGRVRGIRQILNYKPSWPRNDRLGELLDNLQWQAGFDRLPEYGFSFDMQLNPHQFQKAATLIEAYPEMTVIIDHLGSPTLADLTEPDKASRYWQGMKRFAARENTYIKISMLAYTDRNWDQVDAITEAVNRIIETFGIERCFFASNFPVDLNEGWTADRLFTAFRKLVQTKYSIANQQKLFADNAMRAYRVPDL